MRLKQLFIITIIIILSTTLVLGAGIGSRKLKYNVEFISNEQIVFDYQLITTSQKTMDYEFYVLNEDEIYNHPEETRLNFTPYVEFEPKILKNIAPGQNPGFTVKINLPETIEPPGEHGLRVCVQESLSSGGMMGSRSGACGRINVMIPYPGKYLLIALTAYDTDVNKAAKVELFLNSRGLKDIQQITGAINIFNEKDELVKTLPIEKTSLKSRERKTLNFLIDTMGMYPGEYTAKAKINWDEGIKIKEDIFRIGSEKVKLLEITKKYQNNTINPVEMKVKNDWNKKTKNIYATINVGGKQLKTPTIELGAWTEGRLQTYWDTKGLSVGEYPADIKIHYADKEDTYTETFTIVPHKIEKPELQKVKTPISGLMISVIIIIIILVILNALLLLKLRKK
jgi:hypothetical protein